MLAIRWSCTYRKNPKILDTRKIDVINLKLETYRFKTEYWSKRCRRNEKQCRPWSVSTLFAQGLSVRKLSMITVHCERCTLLANIFLFFVECHNVQRYFSVQNTHEIIDNKLYYLNTYVLFSVQIPPSRVKWMHFPTVSLKRTKFWNCKRPSSCIHKFNVTPLYQIIKRLRFCTFTLRIRKVVRT